jgi:hypothetical protein
MSKIEVNQISSQCGSTLTIGQSGDTVTLACGATQTGFGRTGTVDWCTTAKTAPFTGASGKGYFVNTTCGAVTVTLPATPTAGDIISIADYASTFQTNNLTICRNSSKINGVCGNATLSTEGQSITLVYVDGTRGWKNTMDSTSDVSGIPPYIVATGGTITCCGDYKIHTFTADGCFSVSNAGTPAGSNGVDYLVVAGGGGGGADNGGGGGAGGFREGYNPGSYIASPLATTSLPVSITTYPITVGGGGTPGTYPPAISGGNGSNSVFSTITSTGGGGGGKVSTNANTGGSGGGAGSCSPGTNAAGNTPPVSPPQGQPGGNSPTGGNAIGGGGGGATQAGLDAVRTAPYPATNSDGGAGATTSISGTPTAYAGGGGGGTQSALDAGQGGLGGGGDGSSDGPGIPNSNNPAPSGTANTGGGGGGGASPSGANGGGGGSGIVIIRYKFQ